MTALQEWESNGGGGGVLMANNRLNFLYAEILFLIWGEMWLICLEQGKGALQKKKYIYI